ncbi:MAG: DUF1573 domain-containing protein [Elusimicrobia bacterium]|nr:DUF1573 domain-containing protein [Elusimicrobiota bacterium]
MRRFLLLILFSQLAFAQQGPADQSWRLSIKSERSTYIAGEPAPISFEFKNISARPKRIRFPLNFEWGLLVYVTAPDGQSEQYFSAKHLKAAASQRRPPDPVWIEPGQSISYTAHLAYDVRTKTPAFMEPGRYKIAARFPYEEGTASNALELTVKAPDEAEQKALEYLGANSLLPYVDPGGRRLKTNSKQAVKAQEFLKLHGKSVYASPLRLALRDAGLFAQLTTYPEDTIDFNKLPPALPGKLKEHPLFLKNTGQEPLNIKKIGPPELPFRFKSPPKTPLILEPGEMTEFMIVFEPKTPGHRHSLITVESNDLRSPAVMSITGK